MNERKAFTLIELLVVIGVIVILVGILVPVVSHARKQADITAQKSDFQAISAALEAYRQDFGDYPRNSRLPMWNNDLGPAVAGTPVPLEAPAFFSLASALVGPGPASIQNMQSGTTVEAGDGADGLGFRTQLQVQSTALTGGPFTSGQLTISVTTLPSWNTSPTKAQAFQALALTSIVLSPGTPQEETVAISAAAILNATTTAPWITGSSLQLTTPLLFTHTTNDPAPLYKIVTGKTWSNYLPPDRFKVSFININSNADASYYTGGPQHYYYVVGQPVLLDRWGQVIQYFPRFGPNTNRVFSNTPNGGSTPVANSTYTGAPTFSPPYAGIGPLYGYSSPRPIYTYDITVTPAPVQPYGLNAIWDQRDGGVRLTVASDGQTNARPWQPLPVLTGNTTLEPTYDPGIAFRWMLGDDDGDNLIDHGESLRFDGAFILISAGPNQLDPAHGGFCNMYASPPLTAVQKLQVFQNSGNIYNFDR